METTYAEPKVYEPLKIEVLPPNSDNPVLVKQPQQDFEFAPEPTYKDIVLSRPSSITEALPDNQSTNFSNQRQNLSNDRGWKTIDLPSESSTLARHRASSTFTSYFADSTEMYTDPFMVGAGRRFAGSSPQEDETYLQRQQEVFPTFDREAFEAGGRTVDAIKDGVKNAWDYTRDTFSNAWDFYKDGWDNLPDFKLPDFDFSNDEQQREAERDEKQRERRNKRREKRENERKTTTDRLKDLQKRIPENGTALVYFIQSGTWSYSANDPTSSFKRSPMLPGRGDNEIVLVISDNFGNTRNDYVGEGVGEPRLGDWDGTELPFNQQWGARTFRQIMPVFNLAVAHIDRHTNIDSLFKPAIDIDNYGIDGILLRCSGYPDTKPDFSNFTDKPEKELPPDPDDDDDDDDKDKKMSCCSCADIAKIVKSTITSMRYTVNIPVVTCELNKESQIWEPKTEYKDIEIFAVNEATATSQAQIYLNFAQQSLDACNAKNEVPIAAVPESWQIAIDGDRPQLIVLFAEVVQLTDGSTKLGRSRYPISIPHYNKPQEFKPVIPSYKKGQYMGKLVLKDNSKLIVNAYSASEAKRVIAQLVQYINPEMFRKDSKDKPIKAPRIIERGGDELKQIVVTPTNANFFSTGRKDMNPDWVKQFA